MYQTAKYTATTTKTRVCDQTFLGFSQLVRYGGAQYQQWFDRFSRMWKW